MVWLDDKLQDKAREPASPLISDVAPKVRARIRHEVQAPASPRRNKREKKMSSAYKPLHATEFEVESPHVKYTTDTIESTYEYNSTVCTQNEVTGKLVSVRLARKGATSSLLPPHLPCVPRFCRLIPSRAFDCPDGHSQVRRISVPHQA